MYNKWIFQSKGKKIFLLGVQAHNSSSYTAEEMTTAWDACEKMHANTMEVPIYWDKIEPEEGKFDFEMIDYLLAQAREHKKYLILLWFASWKNGNMRYCPLWVKKDKERFKRALNKDGVAVASLSAHNEECRNADAKAFRAVMKHIAEVDSEEQTIIAMQVENEPGYVARTPIDYGPDGMRALKETVPAQVIDFIEKEGKGNEYETWVANGSKRGEAWVETFGKRGYDLCTAYGVATYIDYVAAEGKKEYDKVPYYVNIWMDLQLWDQPGLGYPAGAPVTRNLVLWKSCTPHIDALAPDNYFSVMSQVMGIYDKYSRDDNPLFTPESGPSLANSLNMVRGIGEYGMQGVAFFGAESYTDLDGNIAPHAEEGAYNFQFLSAIAPLIIKYYGTGRIHALYQEEFGLEMQLKLENYEAICSFDSNPASDLGRIRGRGLFFFNKKWQGKPIRGRGILIEAEDGTLYLAGVGLRLSLRMGHDEGVPYSPIVEERNVNYHLVQEGVLDDDGNFTCTRVRSGDETDHAIFVTPDSGVVKIILGEE